MAEPDQPDYVARLDKWTVGEMIIFPSLPSILGNLKINIDLVNSGDIEMSCNRHKEGKLNVQVGEDVTPISYSGKMRTK